MKTETKRFYYSLTTDRVQFEISSSACAPKTIESRMALIEIFKALIDNQNYLHCDAELMEKASIAHDGSCWVFRSEAKVHKP
jgi:hypothetical protein